MLSNVTFPLPGGMRRPPMTQRLLKRAYAVLAAGLALGSASLLAADTPPPAADEALPIGFDVLSNFEFDPAKIGDPTEAAAIKTGNQMIPEAIRKLDGKKVVVGGFMLPLKLDHGVVTEMLLLKNQTACCYGVTPNLNEWVTVDIPKKYGLKPLMDTVVYFTGTFRVGTKLEDGTVSSIYQMDADKMEQ